MPPVRMVEAAEVRRRVHRREVQAALAAGREANEGAPRGLRGGRRRDAEVAERRRLNQGERRVARATGRQGDRWGLETLCWDLQFLMRLDMPHGDLMYHMGTCHAPFGLEMVQMLQQCFKLILDVMTPNNEQCTKICHFTNFH